VQGQKNASTEKTIKIKCGHRKEPDITLAKIKYGIKSMIRVTRKKRHLGEEKEEHNLVVPKTRTTQ
jgi:hypothetical protein